MNQTYSLLLQKLKCRGQPFAGYCLKDGVGSGSAESSSALLGLGWHSSGKSELDVRVVHGLVLGSAALIGLDSLSLQDLNGTGSGAMPGGHLSVHLGDGTAEAGVSVLPVHVLAGGSRVVSDPDAKVLGAAGVGLVDLLALDDLSDLLVDLLVVR